VAVLCVVLRAYQIKISSRVALQFPDIARTPLWTTNIQKWTTNIQKPQILN
jgi:hypothetical protein